MQITLPDKVKRVIRTLQDGGYEAYAVGGCVRDFCLGRQPEDWDITTSARPEEVKNLFRRTVDTGIRHGTVTVLYGNEGFEVTTYRIDGDYEDSRHPKEVTYTTNLTEDLKRRDFTINAMAYSEETGIVDAFGGLADLENGIIRAVGNARERFTEDALRILRAIRFSAQLGYMIEEGTERAIRELAPTLIRISAERIRVEFVKLLLSKHPDRLRIAYETGVTAVILPELDRMFKTEQNTPYHYFNVGEHTLYALQASCAEDVHLDAEEKKLLRLSLLFHDIGKPEEHTVDERGVSHFYRHALRSEELTVRIMRRLKFDNDTLYKTAKLVKYHDYRPRLTMPHVRHAIVEIGSELMPVLFALKRSDIAAQSDYKLEEKLAYTAEFEQRYRQVLADGDCISIRTLAVTGKDLIEAGLQPGRELGDVLQKLFLHVLEEPSHNTKEYLLSKINTEKEL